MNTLVTNLNQLGSKRLYNTSKRTEILEFLGLCAIAILIPLVLKHPQVLVGSVVNFALIMAAINIRGWKKLMPLIVLPSISALLNGYLFGVVTVFLIYMMPFIWAGNALLVLIFKYLCVEKSRGYLLTLPIAVLIKCLVIFGGAMLLFNLSIIPYPIVSAMGMTQLITALIGGSFAFIANFVYKKAVR